MWTSFLRSNGVAETSVKTEVLQDAEDKLRSGEVAGAVSHVTDLPVRMRQAGVEVTMLLFADHGYPMVHGVYLTSTENLTSRRAEIKAMLAAEIRGWSAALADPTAGAQLSATVDKTQNADPQAELARLRALIPLMTSPETQKNGLFTISKDRAAATVSSINTDDMVLGTGLAPVRIDDLFDPSLLAELYAERPDLPR
jgi:ABC-type nitrate/sulfonate/bicarbonate transport system substrate-binding protein